MWYVYILRCADGTFYTGIARDLSRRIDEHNSSNRLGASYTRGRRPVTLVYREEVASRSLALRREHEIKAMGRQEKVALVAAGVTR
ncbi:MAG TPA: GIY-YIG nuclease family protein [Burkholderiales bacterium]|nr:GIY-YIG nuclease family protein [Burkholderiales bacterium]